MSDIPEIQRVTIAYLELEDRIRLTGETKDGKILGLWLTQRLMLRLLPHVFTWLEQQTPTISAPSPENSSQASTMIQSFAQQEARQVLKKQPSSPVPISEKTSLLLVKTLDLSSRAGKLIITFGLADGSKTRLSLSASQLRQWLTIVNRNWMKANWPRTTWPNWMEDKKSPADEANKAFH